MYRSIKYISLGLMRNSIDFFFFSPQEGLIFFVEFDSVLFTNKLLCVLQHIFQRFIYLFFRERGREGEREGEKHQCVVAFCMAPTGDLTHNPGMCPDWELNWQPFGSQPALNPLSYSSQGPTYFLRAGLLCFHLGLYVVFIECVQKFCALIFIGTKKVGDNRKNFLFFFLPLKVGQIFSKVLCCFFFFFFFF